ncbi:MAG: NAD(P)-dependent oxidoreductase [Pseudomonadota bacterium]
MSKPSLAFLGLGIMGLPMCGHLLNAGYPVTVWNRTREKCATLAGKGAVIADTPAAAVDGADFVIAMLSTGPVVTDVLLGRMAAADRMKAGSTVIVMSSIPVETARTHATQLSGKHINYVDAPVSGGEKGAIEAKLTIMAGGDKDVVVGASQILEVMGRLTRVGPIGCGQLAKLANQMIVGITIDAVAEALLLVKAGGGDMAAVRQALLGGFADSTIMRQHGERMISGDFAPGAKSEVQLKDLRTAHELAESLGLSLPVLRLTESLFEAMCDAGHQELDHSGLFRYLSLLQHESASQDPIGSR